MIRQLVLFFLFPILVFGNDSISGDSEAKAKYIFYENGKVGLLNGYGKKIVPAKYDSFSWLKDGVIPAVEKEWFVLIKEDGTVIDKKFWEIGEFKSVNKEGVQPEKLASAALYETKKYGFINISGDFVINPVYDKVRNFSNGFAEVKINGKWGYLDKKGKIAIPAIYDDVWPFSSDGIARVAQKGKQWKQGLINSKGVFILNCEYDELNAVNNILYGYKKSENKSRIFNKDGKILFETNGSGLLTDLGEKMTELSIGYGESIKFNEKYEIIKNREPVLKKENIHEYTPKVSIKGVDKLKFSGSDGYIFFEKAGKMGIASEKAEIIVPAIYDEIIGRNVYAGDEDKNVFRVRQKGLWGVINEKGKIVLNIDFESISPFYLGEAFAQKDGKKYVIKKSGEIKFVTDYEIRSIFFIHDGISGPDHELWPNRDQIFKKKKSN